IYNRIQIGKGWFKEIKTICPDCIIWDTENPYPERHPHIIISMETKAIRLPEWYRLKIGTLIIDEVDTFCTVKRKELFLGFQPKYTIFETATLEKENGLHRIATMISGENGVFEISDTPYYVFVVKTNIMGAEVKGKSGLVTAHTQKSLINNKIRQDIVIDIIKKNLHRKFICMRRIKDGIEEFVEKIRSNGISADCLYGSKKKYSQSHVLVGTLSKMGYGFDEANACEDYYTNPERSNVMIIENSIKRAFLFEQAKGRLRVDKKTVITNENKPVIIWLMDENASVFNHFTSIIPWIRKTNGEILWFEDHTKLIIPGNISV
ncbi:MAG: hypothetical protein O7C56_08490, partial [Rickettsia endosymbiont of Ixodes persulcatus]|nr:hypothetical protein [Rickettsia endosymbiont of Ixodes persulcatus]